MSGLVRPRSLRLWTLLLGALCLLACKTQEGPEAEIRGVITEMVSAAEEPDIGSFLRHVHAEYGDSASNDKDTLRAMLFGYLQRSGGVRVTQRIDRIDLDTEGGALAVVFAALSDGPMTAAGTRAEVLRFDVTLTEESGEWLVRYVRWTPADVSRLLQ